MKVHKAYKVRVYPNEQQQKELLLIMDGCKFVYNYYLNLQINAFFQTGKSIAYADLSRDLTKLRHDTEWLSAIGVRPLQQSLRNLDKAYNRFFRGQNRLPSFKGMYKGNSFSKPSEWSVKDRKINIQRGLAVKYRGTLPPDAEMKTLTVSVTPAGKWYASIKVIEKIEQPKLSGKVGVDLGITHTAITSNGEKFDNLRPQKAQLKKLKKLQQQLARQEKGSNRREKTKQEIARLHEKIANKRINHLHQVSSAIIGKNPALIAVEDLSVVNMMKNRRLARSIADVSWGELLRQLEYKQTWKGGQFVKVDRFFPSSKRCSECGDMQSSMPLNVREWYCNACFTTHDRDVNAAKNILKQAEAQLVAESTDGSRKVRVTGSLKRGYANA